MKLGKLTPVGDVNYDGWEKIYEHEISASDTEAQLLATFQGADNATSGNADTGQTMTFNGTAKIENTQSKIGATSLYLDGNSDYVTVPDSADWDIVASASTDATVDFWIRFNTVVSNTYCLTHYEDANNFWSIRSDSNGFNFLVWTAGALINTGSSATGALVADTWYHVAMVKEASKYSMYVDGVLGVSVTDSSTENYVGVLAIGSKGSFGNYVDGYMDGVRITKGEALWTSNFTPPTTIDDYVSTSAITIFGLEGDTDEQYMLDVNAQDVSNIANLGLRFNGDTATNYGYQFIKGENATISAGRSSLGYIIIGSSAVSGELSSCNILINAKSGYVRTALNSYATRITGTTVDDVLGYGASWNNTADEITSMNIFTSGAGTMAVGSTISLYKRKQYTIPVFQGGYSLDTDGLYTVATFTAGGTFTPTSSFDVDALVVAGGGGGGTAGARWQCGGGGAGGVLYDTSRSITAQAYAIFVGNGGNAASNGSNSVFDGLTAIGGGAGGSGDDAGSNGGSGGGGSAHSNPGGSGTSGQGNDGGSPPGSDNSSGGGGKGAAGSNTGPGGAGQSYSITGTSTYYAGGGGGGGASGGGAGGTGGGGTGGSSPTQGTDGLGGGGGGAYNTTGAKGGSGVVILRMLTSDLES